MDVIVKQLAGHGLPGIILLILGFASAGSNAAIVAVLTAAGGPFGILGGIGLLGLTELKLFLKPSIQNAAKPKLCDRCSTKFKIYQFARR